MLKRKTKNTKRIIKRENAGALECGNKKNGKFNILLRAVMMLALLITFTGISITGVDFIISRKDAIKGESAEKVNEIFEYTGDYQTFTAPYTGYYNLEVWGAEGGGSRLSGNTASGIGGKGGYSSGVVRLQAGEKLYIYIGGQGGSNDNGIATGGYNGGGSGYGSGNSEPGNGGGGATDIRINGTTLYNRLIVAGGGGRRWRRYRR